jgi:hypothetical protein
MPASYELTSPTGIWEEPEAPPMRWRPAIIAGVPEQSSWRYAADTNRVAGPVDYDYYIVPGTGGHGRARADALLEVINTFGCQVAVYGYNATRSDTFLVMTGTVPALDVLELLLPRLAADMETAGRTAAAEQVARDDVPRRAVVTPYFRDYLRGFGHGAAEAIRSVRTEMFRTHGPVLGELVADAAASVERAFTARFGTRKPLRRERGGNPLAWKEGAAAGYGALDPDDYLLIHDLVFAML